MRGAWLTADGVQLRDDLQVPTPSSNEALLRVRRAGICHTDLELLRGYAGFTGIPGHEFVADVVAGPEDWSGNRVVAEINTSCNACGLCSAGHGRHCRTRKVLGIRAHNGAFAEYLVVRTDNLHRVDAAIPDTRAVFVEPLAAALRICEQVVTDDGRAVLVVGDGKLGQLVTRALAARGSRISVVGRHPRKLDLLRGCARVLSAGDAAEGAFDIAIDCSGRPDGLLTAIAALRPQGTLVVKTTCHEPTAVPMADVVVKELTVIGSRCGPFEPALAMLREHDLGLEELCEATYSLADVDAALAHAARPGALKIQLQVG